MSRTARASRALAALAALLLAACATSPPMPIGQVITRSQQGQSSEQIVNAIRTSRTTFALRGSDFCRLRQAGVSDAVLDHLQQSFFDDVDLLTRLRASGQSVGGCVRCVPQQVDLSDLSKPTQSPTRTSWVGFAPQGMPDWFRPFHAPSGRALTLDAIVQMTKQGVPEQEQIATVRSGRLEPIVGTQSLFSGIRTRPVAALTGSALAHLCTEGVPEAVVDEVQTKFLGQFVEIARLRYQNLGVGPGANVRF